MKTLLHFILGLGLTTLVACQSTNTIITEGTCNQCQDAVIRDYGDPALDGCGFVVDIDSKIYMPKNLPKEYQVDELKVKMKFEVRDSTRCGMIQYYEAISINEIRKN
ncbi:MAG: hypothetical protein AAF489_04060 [Bacteroidota bacterium]